MSQVKSPRSLRSFRPADVSLDKRETVHAAKVTTVFGLMAVASISGADAQSSNLPPVTVDAPTARPKPAAKPNQDDVRARNAIRRAARAKRLAQQEALRFPNAGGLTPPDANPYADPAAPYKADRLASTRFSEPILNTPRSVTVLTKELLDDKNATSFKEVARTTAGVTLGTGEGGNAFGDRFFIRGFDARNDVFIDGIRDPAVSIRENFFTEQVEILRGPASSYAGRGTTGGAVNIVTKQAGDRNFYEAESTLGTDRTKRITVDINQVISPTLSIRMGGLGQDAGIAGRDVVYDNRYGGFGAIKWTPTDNFKVTANYVHTDLKALPDFGVPWDRATNQPAPDAGYSRSIFYGFANRDFQKTTQDFGTLTTELKMAPDVTLTNRFRAERAVLDYVGTIAEAPRAGATPAQNPLNFNPAPGFYSTAAGLAFVQLNSVSRYQVTDVLANQTDLTFKFDTGPWKHTAVAGAEISRERTSLDSYAGLTTESLPGGATSVGSIVVPINNPGGYTFASFPTPQLAGMPTILPLDTKALYLIDTANYADFVILNAGARVDDYQASVSSPATPGSRSQFADNAFFNYNGGITIKPVPFGSVYAAYATSSNPACSQVDGTSIRYGGCSTAANVTYNQILPPEQNKAAEVGTKWELFERHLLVTAALFQTQKDNAAEIIGTGPTTQAASTAAYQIRGIDLGASGKLNPQWSLYGGLVLMESKVLKTSLAPTAAFPSYIGLPLANIAHQSFNLLTKYEFTDRWELGGQATYNSKRYGGNLFANTTTSLPSYWRFDSFLEHKIDKNMTLKLYVNNILNKTYYDGFYNSAAPFVYIAPGRSAGIVATAKF
jgi:catecholate siderophore receptor